MRNQFWQDFRKWLHAFLLILERNLCSWTYLLMYFYRRAQCERTLASIRADNHGSPLAPPFRSARCRPSLVNIPLLFCACFIRSPFSICGGCFVFAAVFDSAAQSRPWQWWILDLRCLAHNELGPCLKISLGPARRQAVPADPGQVRHRNAPPGRRDAGGSPQASQMSLCLTATRLADRHRKEARNTQQLTASWSITLYLYCLKA